jgi:hypothetical protein
MTETEYRDKQLDKYLSDDIDHEAVKNFIIKDLWDYCENGHFTEDCLGFIIIPSYIYTDDDIRVNVESYFTKEEFKELKSELQSRWYELKRRNK